MQNDVSNAESSRRNLGLSPRESEILSLIVAGFTNKTIARQLSISHRTVEAHRSHIKFKIGARNTADLVRISCVG